MEVENMLHLIAFLDEVGLGFFIW